MNREGIYFRILKRLKSLKKKDIKIIEFPLVFHKLGTSLQLDKKGIWELLFFLQDMGIIQILYKKGIIINAYEGGENGSNKRRYKTNKRTS